MRRVRLYRISSLPWTVACFVLLCTPCSARMASCYCGVQCLHTRIGASTYIWSNKLHSSSLSVLTDVLLAVTERSNSPRLAIVPFPLCLLAWKIDHLEATPTSHSSFKGGRNLLLHIYTRPTKKTLSFYFVKKKRG